MKATGKIRQIVKRVGQIQNLVGKARGAYWNDRQADRAEAVITPLEEAFKLCLEITGEYDPIPEGEPYVKDSF